MKALLRGWCLTKGPEVRESDIWTGCFVGAPAAHLLMFLCIKQCSTQMGPRQGQSGACAPFLLPHTQKATAWDSVMIMYYTGNPVQGSSTLRVDACTASFKFPELQRAPRAGRMYPWSSGDILVGQNSQLSNLQLVSLPSYAGHQSFALFLDIIPSLILPKRWGSGSGWVQRWAEGRVRLLVSWGSAPVEGLGWAASGP